MKVNLGWFWESIDQGVVIDETGDADVSRLVTNLAPQSIVE